MKREISRRDFVKGSGALVVSFSAVSFVRTDLLSMTHVAVLFVSRRVIV